MTMTMLNARVTYFFEKYGFFLVLLFSFRLLTPNFASKSSLMEMDFANMVANDSGSSAFKQLFLILMFILYLLLAFQNVKNLSYRILARELSSAVYLLITLVAFCAVSAIWSVEPLLTLKRSLAQFLLIFIIYQSLLFSTLHSNNFNNIRLLLIATLVYVVISLVLGVGINSDGQLCGFQQSKNEMGSILSVIFVLFYMMKGKDANEWLNVSLLVIAFLFLISTGSKSGVLLTVLFIVLSWLPNHVLRLMIALSGLIFVVVFLLAPIYTSISSDTLQPTERWNIANVVGQEFFTGRGQIWSSVYYQLEYFNKMVFGYGYGAFFGRMEIPYFFDVDDSYLRYINSAHNGYIEILSQLGVFGVFLISFIVLGFSMLRNSYLLSAAFFILAYNFTESTFLRGVHVIWVMTILILLYDRISNITRNINET